MWHNGQSEGEGRCDGGGGSNGGGGLRTGLMISQRAAWSINSGDLLSGPRTTPSAPMAPATNNPHRGERER